MVWERKKNPKSINRDSNKELEANSNGPWDLVPLIFALGFKFEIL